MKTTLSDIVEFFNGKKRPRSIGNIPVYGGNGIIDYVNDFNATKNTIIIGRVGAYCGNVNISSNNCWVTDNAIGLAVKNGVEPLYLYYFLISKNLVKYSGGSKQSLISHNQLGKISIDLPEYSLQKKISDKISIIEKRIFENTNSNILLEELSQTLFHKWFVDFNFPDVNGNPYKDFGGKMVVVDGKVLPQGWKRGKFTDLMDVSCGKRPVQINVCKSDVFNIPVYGASKIIGYTNQSLFCEPIIITGRVGTNGILMREHEECWPSDNTLIINSKKIEYVYQLLKRTSFSKLNIGSSQSLITKNDLNGQFCIIPEDRNIFSFDELVKPMMAKINLLIKENILLVEVRDLLIKKITKLD